MLDRDHISEINRVLNLEETGRDRLVNDSWRRYVELYDMDPTRAISSPRPGYGSTANNSNG